MLACAYNALSTALMEEIVDFLQVLYRTSNREDPYWKAVRHDTKLSDWLTDNLELWRCRFPDLNDTFARYLFGFSNYTYVMVPKGYFSGISSPLDSSIRFEDWQSYGRELKQKTARLLNTLPDHYQLLTAIRATGCGVPAPEA
jgi:hypothetical protein